MAIIEEPDLFAAACAMSSFTDVWSHLNSKHPSQRSDEFGPYDQPDKLKSISPLHLADRIKTPLLMVHGAKDMNVRVDQSQRLVKKLRDRGHDVQYIEFPDEGHSILKPANRMTVRKARSKLFEWHLLGRHQKGLDETPRIDVDTK